MGGPTAAVVVPSSTTVSRDRHEADPGRDGRRAGREPGCRRREQGVGQGDRGAAQAHEPGGGEAHRRSNAQRPPANHRPPPLLERSGTLASLRCGESGRGAGRGFPDRTDSRSSNPRVGAKPTSRAVLGRHSHPDRSPGTAAPALVGAGDCLPVGERSSWSSGPASRPTRTAWRTRASSLHSSRPGSRRRRRDRRVRRIHSGATRSG